MDDLQRVLDEAAIRRVLVQYCRGVDRGDEALIRDVYWPDATDDHGSFKGSGSDFATRVVAALNARALSTQHGLQQTQIIFAVDAEAPVTAQVETYVVARHKLLRDGQLTLETFGGRYLDRFEKRAGAWRIQHRQVIHDWSNIVQVTNEYPNEHFVQGRRDLSDASYAP